MPPAFHPPSSSTCGSSGPCSSLPFPVSDAVVAHSLGGCPARGAWSHSFLHPADPSMMLFRCLSAESAELPCSALSATPLASGFGSVPLGSAVVISLFPLQPTLCRTPLALTKRFPLFAPLGVLSLIPFLQVAFHVPIAWLWFLLAFALPTGQSPFPSCSVGHLLLKGVFPFPPA